MRVSPALRDPAVIFVEISETAEECRNREKAEFNKPISNSNSRYDDDNNNSNSYKGIWCYGCGKAGVVRSKCDLCNGGGKRTTDFNIAFVDKPMSSIFRSDVEHL